jgi:hypothetical protein
MDPNEVDRDKVDPRASELYDLTKSFRQLRREHKRATKAAKESPEARELRLKSEERMRRQRPLNESRIKDARKKHEREQRKVREAKKKRKRQQRAIQADRDRRARQQRRIKQREAANRLDIKGIASRMRSSAKRSPAKQSAKAQTSSAPVDQTPAVPRVAPRPSGVSTSPEWATDSQAIRLRDLIATRQLLLSPKVRQACGSLSARAFEQWRASMSQVPSGLTAKGVAAWIEELEPLPRTTVETPPDH